jgi:hypothetical protein
MGYDDQVERVSQQRGGEKGGAGSGRVQLRAVLFHAQLLISQVP